MTTEETVLPHKLKICLFYFLLTFFVWLLLTWTLEPMTVFVGLLGAFITVLFLWDILPPYMTLLFEPRRLFWFLVYIPYFFYYVLKANLDVAYRVLHPDMPIKPGIVKVRTKLIKDLSKTFLANSITLTPGTMTVDIDGEYLYIHCINVISDDIEKATKNIVEDFETILWRIFE